MVLIRRFLLPAACAALLITAFTGTPAFAQRHGGGHIAGPRGGVVVGAYYRPLYYDPFFYDPFWYPFYPYGWYPPYAAYGPYYVNTASLRLQVTPSETDVFVDGYYAGTVDSFDGAFQRLHLEPGEHELTLYREGHHSITQQVLLQPGKTFRIRHAMVPLAAGEAPDPRPASRKRPPAQRRSGGGEESGAAPEPGRGDPAFGAIAIRVQPPDADVLIDGERWEGPASNEALVVQLSPGRHQVEVRKDGYRSYTAPVDVRADQTAPLNISLPKQ